VPEDADDLGNEREEEVRPDPSLTRELFLQWRNPRRGRSNPENQTNPIWTWLVRSRLGAFRANAHFDGPCATEAGPGWCAERFGQSLSELPDGRVLCVAGEHEDFYDADFFIYNDVILRHPDGRIEIFGYPREIFPPTDFHSATLVGNRLILIGNLGYPEDRRPHETPVFALDLTTFAFAPVSTSGGNPGWIHGHTASLSADRQSLLVHGGKLDPGGPGRSLPENIDDWRLDLVSWTWKRLTRRDWPRWEFARADGRANHLWEIEQAAWARQVGWEKDFQDQMDKLETRLGVRPDLDLLAALFHPPLDHEALPGGDEEYNTFRRKIGGVTVRYVVDMNSVTMTVEGSLSAEHVSSLASDLRDKLSRLEGVDFVATSV
jgi:hypothetical protein